MHSAACPSCGKRVEVDFVPAGGLVWCPDCQKLFSPPVVPTPGSGKTEPSDIDDDRDAKLDD